MATVNHIDDGIFTISGLFSPAECDDLIKRGEDLGYEAAGVRTSDGPKMMTKVRNNDRAEFKDKAFADDVWARVEPYIPPVLDGVRATGLFPNFRFYRYDPGQRFKRHIDGAVDMPNGDRSKLTLLIYLNEGYSGGATVFSNYEFSDGVATVHNKRITPQTGLVLVFRHELKHEGEELVDGRKYVLRTDVLYERE